MYIRIQIEQQMEVYDNYSNFLISILLKILKLNNNFVKFNFLKCF